MKLFIITIITFTLLVFAAIENQGFPARKPKAPTVLIIDKSSEKIISNVPTIEEGTCEEVVLPLDSAKRFTPFSSRDPYTVVVQTSTSEETHYDCVPFKNVENSIGYQESGKASWYGPGFHKRKTASGRIYDQKSHITVAHKTLPLGSILKVDTNTGSVCVLVDDRGPFHPGRVVDLSETIAKKIGVYQEGTAEIVAKLVGYINLKELKGHPTPKSITC